MEIIRITTPEQFNMLYIDSALTIEGLAEESIPDFINWAAENAGLKEETAYLIKGEDMNNQYGLTGHNSYSDDLTIVSIMLKDMDNPMNIVLKRFDIGGRWFNDIVDNNLYREIAKETINNEKTS